jgi:hypothetical protein
VIVIDPDEAVGEAVKVNAGVAPRSGSTVTGLVVTEQVKPVVPTQEKLTVPENPKFEMRLKTSLMVPPTGTFSDELLGVNRKSG